MRLERRQSVHSLGLSWESVAANDGKALLVPMWWLQMSFTSRWLSRRDLVNKEVQLYMKKLWSDMTYHAAQEERNKLSFPGNKLTSWSSFQAARQRGEPKQSWDVLLSWGDRHSSVKLTEVMRHTLWYVHTVEYYVAMKGMALLEDNSPWGFYTSWDCHLKAAVWRTAWEDRDGGQSLHCSTLFPDYRDERHVFLQGEARQVC